MQPSTAGLPYGCQDRRMCCTCKLIVLCTLLHILDINQTHVRENPANVTRRRTKVFLHETIGWHYYKKSLNKCFVNMLQIFSVRYRVVDTR